MSNESVSSARQRFVRDLRRIREQRGVSIKALHEATQVPEPHLRAFEEGTLDERSRMNVVYLKAFVRAYAEALEVPSEPVVELLEAALEGNYENQLAARFLEDPPSVAGDQQSLDPESSLAADQDTVSEQTVDSPEKGGSGSPEEASQEESSSDSETVEVVEVPDGAEGDSIQDDSRSSFTPSLRSERSTPSREGVSSLSSSVHSSAQQVWWQYGGTLISTALILLVLALGGGVLGGYFGGEGSGSSPGSASAPSADLTNRLAAPDTNAFADTVRTELATAPPRRPVNLTQGDTLYAVVEATSVVAGMRVQQDDDLRRPYWIEPGEVQVFPFTRRITFENQLDSLRLFLENYPYPTTRMNQEGRVIINRDTAEQFADTLRGAPTSFPSPSDTIKIGPVSGSDSDTLAQNP